MNYVQSDGAVASQHRPLPSSETTHLLCNNSQFSQLAVCPHRKGQIPVPEFQWWRFYCLSNLHSAFRMRLSFTSAQLLCSAFWCTKPGTTRKCPAHFPDSDLLYSGKSCYSLPIVHSASSWDGKRSLEREEERGMLFSSLCSWCHGYKGDRAASPKS